MRIELADLQGGKGSFTHSYAPGEPDLQDSRVTLFEPPAGVSGEIRQKGQRVRVAGRVSGLVKVECDRCLKPVKLPVDSRFDVEYVTVEDYQAQQADELSQRDLELSIFDGVAIDIDDLVKEELLLAVPDQVVCDESCKGMCAVCGLNRNSNECECETHQIDPRWAELKKLVNSKS